VLQVWRVLQQPPFKWQVIVVLADMPLPRQFESDLLVLNVAKSVLQTSVSAVIYACIKDHSDIITRVYVIVDIDGLPEASKQAVILACNAHPENGCVECGLKIRNYSMTTFTYFLVLNHFIVLC